jgi:hypothetical protein
MKMIYQDPNNLLGLHALSMSDDDRYYDQYGNEYEYDEFIGKWLRKRKARRAKDPKIIARRIKADEKRLAKGKNARYPELLETRKPALSDRPKEVLQIKVAKDLKAVKGSLENPITNKDLKSHAVINNAIQNELKTAQEELKTQGLQKKVEQEDLKKETLVQQAGLMGTGKGLMVVVGVLAALALLSHWSKNKSSDSASTKAA